MNKFLKRKCLSLFVCFVVFAFWAPPAQAFSISLNPIIILQQTTKVIISRVSDIIHYLIMQKRYIFDNFTDPNIYLSLDVPTGLDNIISSTTAITSEETVSSKLTVVTTSTPPSVKTPTPVTPAVIAQNQSTSSFPTPIIKSADASNTIVVPISNYNNNSQILTFTNIERLAASLKPLSANAVLDTIASLRVDDLFTNQYFEHVSPDGKSVSDLVEKMDYNYLLIGENLALGNFDGDQGIVTAWMESPGHRANILNTKYTELGVSVKAGIYKGANVTIAVQVFSLPLDNCPKPTVESKTLIDTSTVSVKKMQQEAIAMYNNLTALKNTAGVDQSYYNQKIQEYNYFARKVNEAIATLKTLVDEYNVGVSKYNACITL